MLSLNVIRDHFARVLSTDDLNLTRSKSIIGAMIVAWLFAYFGPLVALHFFPVDLYQEWERLFLIIGGLVTCASGWLLYRNSVKFSAILLLAMAWLTTTAFLMARGGIRVPISQFYALIVVASVFLLGKRIGLFIAVLSVLLTVTLGWLESLGLITGPELEPTVLRFWSVHFLFLLLMTVITYLVAADVQYNFELTRTATLEAQERQTVLEQRRLELEAINTDLTISERRYRHFFNGTPVMMHSIDQQGILVDVNEFWLKTLGYEKHEVIGRRSTEFMTPESQRYATDVVLPIYFRDGHIRDIPYQMVKKSGDVIDVLLSASELRDQEGQFLHSLASIVDITQQKHVESELRESEVRFRTLVNSAADCFLLLNTEGNLIGVNDYACHTLGYARDELMGMPMEQFTLDWTPERMHETASQMELNVPATVPSILIRKDGGQIPAETRIVITTIDNEPVFLGLARDVSEQNKAQLALEASERRFRSLIFNQAQQFIGLVETEGRLVEVNQSALEFGGVKRSDVIGQYFWDTIWWRHDEEGREQLKDALLLAAQGQSVQYEVEVRGMDEALITIDFSLTPIRDDEDTIVYLLAEGRDITELHQSTQALARSLHEKELLLKEIHHRVKNNLQIVSSILRLQASKTNTPLLLDALNESQSRIRSMQLIHEQLYRSDDLALINLAMYCRSLTTEVLRLHRPSGVDVDLQLNLENISVDIDKATTCGFIFHEMLSNALKYAFVQGESGVVIVDLELLQSRQVRLAVTDNGVGIPEDTDFPNATSLGFRLMVLLAAQISGEISLTREPSTKLELSFDLEIDNKQVESRGGTSVDRRLSVRA